MGARRDSKDPVQNLKDKIHAGKVPGLSSELYFQLQDDIIGRAQEDLLVQNGDLRQQIEDLRRVNVDLDVATDHLDDINSQLSDGLEDVNDLASERSKKIEDLQDLLVILLMPWARFMGDLSLYSFVLKLAKALGSKFGPIRQNTVDEVIAKVYSEKSRLLTLQSADYDEVAPEAAPAGPLEKSLEEFRGHHKKFMT